jgi:hypothetical protein
MRDWVIAISGQAGKRPAPLIAGHIYLIRADRTTAQTRWRQPFFLPRHKDVRSVHKGFLESIREWSSHSDLTIRAKPTCQISVKFP